ncbi:unnamed protein product [Rotaria sordida]|uniref:G-protein coupled receptors family 1 profile domain-containing protein n=1 Tax=Rotaria sordida TaxID=392033 RepID=A0A820BMH0_9BILA|nr:unnamed protein product [Rotaria sordida]
MSNTTSDLVQKLNIATYWIDQIYPLLQIAFGTFGNVFNIIIFSRRALRSNPCSLYFLVGSIDNCVVIGIGICSRYLASSWYWDPSATNIVLCKLRNFVIYSSLTLALCFFAPIISCILPIVLMSIFGILMILNVRRVHNQVGRHINNARNERLHSNDRQLAMMLLFQILITTLISTPYFALAIYNAVAIVMFRYKLSPSELASYNFANNLFRLLHYTNPVITFYIYTLTGPKFRVEMKHCIQHGLKSVLTAIGLVRYLPLRARQVLFGENQVMNTINIISLSQSRRRGNGVHPTQQKTTMSMTPVA